MAAPRTIDVQEFIDARPLSAAQARVVAICALVVGLDGFDVAIVGHIAPALRAEWGLDVAALGPLFAAGLFGLMIGALVVGPLADRYGRKTLLVASVTCFGVASIASAFSDGIATLNWLRFLTGLGLGGAMPAAITLTSEFCPISRRASLVTIMFCGFTLGSALGGLVSAQVVTGYGWRPLLVGGGIAPLALAPVLWWVLPESVRYLVARRPASPEIAATLARIAPGEGFDGVVFTGSAGTRGDPVGALLRPEFRQGTLLLWLAFFMSLLVVYLLSNWMPTLIVRSGSSLSGASRLTAAFQIGGTVGAISLGWLMDRFPAHRVVGAAYLAAAACVALMGVATATPVLMAVAVFGAGFGVSGGQTGANALAAAFYPTACRTTGVSWALGIGRSGSIVGSLVGGAMLAQGWALGTVYGLVAIPVVVAGVAILIVGDTSRRRGE
jgi:AAHS family 4-hydroxybenzoate transporter-like MFS transporter